MEALGIALPLFAVVISGLTLAFALLRIQVELCRAKESAMKTRAELAEIELAECRNKLAALKIKQTEKRIDDKIAIGEPFSYLAS